MTALTDEQKRLHIRQLINMNGRSGKIFSVNFIKKDGTHREMTCRLDVRKHLKGGASTTSHIDNLMTVYDMQSQGYRSISLDKVFKLKISGQTFNFD